MISLIQQVIPFIPWLVVAFLGVLALAAFVIHKRAVGDPAKTWEDDFDAALPQIQDAAFQGADWLGKTMALKGEEKLSLALDTIKKIEVSWKAGKKTEAASILMAFLWDARGKAERAGLSGSPALDCLAGKLEQKLNQVIPTSSVPPVGSPTVAGSGSR